MRGQFVLEQQGAQFVEAQCGAVDQPAQFQQRCGSARYVADLGIAQFADTKVHALAHHQTYQQRLRGQWQLGEIGDEGALGVVHQVAVMGVEPGEGLAEVGQVIEFGGVEAEHGAKFYWFFIQIPGPFTRSAVE